MMPTMVEAVDEIQSQFWTAWKAATPALNGGQAVDVRWPNDDAEKIPPQGVPWARVVVQHVNGDQYSLGTPGQRLFEHIGLLVIQIYTPVGRGLALARNLATIAKNSVEGTHTTSGVWFRHCHFQEVGQDAENPEMKAWDQFNFIAQFVYDEQR